MTATRRPTLNTEQKDEKLEVADYETALDAAGYGRFSRSALGACATASFTAGLQNCVMAYVLPAARCDLELTTYQAGLVHVAFLGGGIVSAFFWLIAGDVFGRRNMLSISLLIDGVLTLAQSTVSDYRLLFAARVCNGFVIGCPQTLVYSYLSDLVGTKKRQLYLDIVGLTYVSGWFIAPAFAWLVIPFNVIEYETLLPIYSWRLFLALACIPGFVCGSWLLTLPESPRLLLDTNRSEKALEILVQIHKSNNGSNAEYKIKNLIQDEVFVGKTLSFEEKSRTQVLFLSVLNDLKTFLSKSYIVKALLIIFMFFANMSAGFGLTMWIPELLLRIQGRDCPLAASIISRLKYDSYGKEIPQAGYYDDVYEGHFDVCDATIDQEVFTSGLIVGACCIFGTAACAVLCARTGAKGIRYGAMACTAVCAIACATLAATACSCTNFTNVAVGAAAVLNAASLSANVLVIRLMLHVLPPKLGALGICWGAFWGRTGGMASNFAVGALLDYSCSAIFIAVGSILALSIGTILVIKFDVKEVITNEEVKDQEKNTGLD